MPLSRNSLLVRAADVTSATVDDELMMMRLAANAYFGLDDIGTRIWALLEKPMTLGEVCRVLQSEYDVAPEQCEHDVLLFMADLADKELVHASRPNAE